MERFNQPNPVLGKVAMRITVLMAVCCSPNVTRGEEAVYAPRIAEQLATSETDYGVTISGLKAFARMEKASRMRPLYSAMVTAEQERIALRRESSAAARSRRRVEMATYHDQAQASGVVTLIRRKKISVANAPAPVVDESPDPPSKFEPLVVTQPPSHLVRASNAELNDSIALVKKTHTIGDELKKVESPNASSPFETSPFQPPLREVAVESVRVDKTTQQAIPQSESVMPGLVAAPRANATYGVQSASNANTKLQAVRSPRSPSDIASQLKTERTAILPPASAPLHSLADHVRKSADVIEPSQDHATTSNDDELRLTAIDASSAKPLEQTSPSDRNLSPAPPTIDAAAATPILTAPVENQVEAVPVETPRTRRKWTPIPVDPSPTDVAHTDVKVNTPVAAAPATSSALGHSSQATTSTGQAATKPEVEVRATAPDARVAQWPFSTTSKLSDPTSEQVEDNLVSLNVDAVDVRTVFELLHKGYGMNILVAPDVSGTVTANVSGLSPEQALRSVVKMCNLAIQTDGDVTLIYPADGLPRDARRLQVFPLDFARAEVIEATIQGILSPVGSAYTSAVDELDNRQARESVVVIDIPEVLEQVDYYIAQIDQAPRQVLIEARVLEIELRDNNEHGINFEQFFGRDLQVGAFQLTDSLATSTNPFFFADINGSELDAVLTMLETTTDAKTLATPQVMVVNGQNAKIQVGQQLGFAVATVTQTATVQDVRYLDTGVVLDVTPTIARDGRILMQVKPKVSTGAINPNTLLPEETTRQVETSVMLNNHQGMIVGGLIQEEDRVVIRKLPWVGDFKFVGPLFQRREAVRTRSEIIVALIPHIVEGSGHHSCQDPESLQTRWERTDNPLFHGPLNRNCRPSEARLPDVKRESPVYQDMRRQRNLHPYCKGCEPIPTKPIWKK